MSKPKDFLSNVGANFDWFPCKVNGKTPAITGWQKQATNDVATLEAWWARDDYNPAVRMGKYGDRWLFAFDVDCKQKEDGTFAQGLESLRKLEAEGFKLPKTLTVKTWSKGLHFYFWADFEVRNKVNLYPGIDIRGEGGYVVGASSVVNGETYEIVNGDVIETTPEWLAGKVRPEPKTQPRLTLVEKTSQHQAEVRSISFLAHLEPVFEGHRNPAAYRAACGLKENGLVQESALQMMLDYWRCEPMLDESELSATIRSAYGGSQNAFGSNTPEAAFDKIEIDPKAKGPIEKISETHFSCLFGGEPRIMRETTDEQGHFTLEPMSIRGFEHYFRNHKLELSNGETMPLAKAWLKDPNTRNYTGLTFAPDGKPNATKYNLWRGFLHKPVKTASPEATKAVDLFFDHILNNICNGDQALSDWLVTFLADMFQRPHIKPVVAVGIHGEKGTGKSMFTEIVSELCAGYAATVVHADHILGKFNSTLENKIMVVLNEAFFSGDKKSEGALKDLVTAKTRMIERKYADGYMGKAYERVFMLSNDEHIVPASSEERRYAIFSIGEARRGDAKYFGEMKDGLENGGYGLLMQRLLDWDLSKANIMKAPQTQGLSNQKERSLDAVQRWWKECAEEGFLIGHPAGYETWPDRVPKRTLFDSFRRWVKDTGCRSYPPSNQEIGRQLRKLMPSAKECKVPTATGRVNGWQMPPLDKARAEIEKVLNMPIEWPPLDDSSHDGSLDAGVKRVYTFEDLL